MPQRECAKKALRQSVRRKLCNKSVKSKLGTETTKFERALERGDAQAAATQLTVVTKLLHQAAAKGIMHPKTASRRQARLQQGLNKVQVPG